MFLNKYKAFIIRSIKHHLNNNSQVNKMWHVEDNRLSTFTRICDEIANERSYLNKAEILKEFFRKGCDKKEFKGDLLLWVRMLIPGDSQRVYNLQNKQMVKLFSRLFNSDPHEMQLDLEQGRRLFYCSINNFNLIVFVEGDISETLRKFFESSKQLKPQANSTLYLQEVEEFLQKLEQRTKEDEQTDLLRQLCKQSTTEDLKTVSLLVIEF